MVKLLIYTKSVIVKNSLIGLLLFLVFVCNVQGEELKPDTQMSSMIKNVNIPCKILVRTETKTITDGMILLSLSEEEFFVPELITVKETINNKEYKAGTEFAAGFSYSPNMLVISIPPMYMMPNAEKPPDGTEFSITYSYIPGCNNDDNSYESPVTLLKRVARNWELIKDMSALLNTSNDLKPEVITQNFVFKNPNKWKLSHSNRIVIVNGEKEIFIPTGKNPEIGHLPDLYEGMALWWLPYRYQIEDFLKHYRLFFGDKINGLVVIECICKIAPGSGEETFLKDSRFRIFVDKDNYETVVERYDWDGDLSYRLEILERETIGNIKIPKKYQEIYPEGSTPIDKSGAPGFESPTKYFFTLSNIRLNTGVSDEEFK